MTARITLKRRRPSLLDKGPFIAVLVTIAVFSCLHVHRLSPHCPETRTSAKAPTGDVSKVEVGPEDPFRNLLRSGDGWQMWDRQSIPTKNAEDVVCEWTSILGGATKMCTYPEEQDIYVSGEIQREGKWRDCAEVIEMWKMNKPAGIENDDEEDEFLVEIGVNIGACLMEMLLYTKAKIIGFEANPRNVAQVATTLMAQPKDMRDRVALFPIGLGNNATTGIIHAAANNQGNSVVNSVVRDYDSQNISAPIPIILERLDTILPGYNMRSNNNKAIRLIKMDVQGFECNVMDAGMGVFRSARALKTEVEKRFLDAQSCSVDGLLDRIEAAGFQRPKKAAAAAYDIHVSKNPQ